MQSTPAAYRQWQIIWKVSVCARVAVPVCVQGGSDALFSAQLQKLRGKNKCFIFAVKKFYDYET